MSDLLERMAEALRECADDLQAELEARYDGMMHIFPDQKRRYLRDMRPVDKARELLTEFDQKKE